MGYKKSYSKKSNNVSKAVKGYLRKNYPKPEIKQVGLTQMNQLNLLSPLVYNLTTTRQGDSTNERIGMKIRGKDVKLSIFMHNSSSTSWHVRIVVVEHLDYSQAIDVTTPLYKTYTAGGTVALVDFASSEGGLLNSINDALFRVKMDRMFFLAEDGHDQQSWVKFNRVIKYDKDIIYQLPTDADPRSGRLSLAIQIYDADGNAIVTPTGIHVGMHYLLSYTDS